MHEGAWTLIEVQGTLDMLFEQQYTLTATVDTVTGYRTQRPQLADLDDGAAPPAGDDETEDDAPSDVFFKYTYAAPDPDGVTHVGIYVGDGVMLHCGHPVGYANIANSSYWQEHLFAYGRLY